MVISLGPGKFYGNSLPRPRYYTDIKYNTHRVDPPVPVLEPFLNWAHDAHWSMGGLSSKRLRLQGRIEGNANRLRNQIEKQSPSRVSKPDIIDNKTLSDSSPPPAPVAVKRKRRMMVESSDDDDDSSESEDYYRSEGKEKVRGVARKLVAEFDKVVTTSKGVGEDVDDLGFNGESKRKKKNKTSTISTSTSTSSGGRVRTSPRLAKRKLI